METSEHNCHPDAICKASVAIGLLFILLLALPVSLPCNLQVCDILAFAMLICLAMKIRASLFDFHTHGRIHLFPPTLLLAFLATALLATAIHLHCSFADYYEWLVFAYVAFIFHFYSNIRIQTKPLAICGTAILSVILLAFAYEIASTPFGCPTLFCFLSDQMDSTAMSFLSRRFSFTLGNPNVFACFYILPLLMLTPFVLGHDWKRHSLSTRLLYFPLCLIILLPILSSASKHGLMSLAIIASWMKPIFMLRKKSLDTLMLAGVLAVALIFELTVVFTAFPLQRSFPFINTQPGMYSLHQGIYAKISINNPSSLFMGMGINRAKQEYPKFADKALTRSVLERYNAMPSYENFISFMDAHNEFLNQIVLFGLIPLLTLLSFLLKQARGHTAILFITALLCCCLWDDLLSKRPIWIALALLQSISPSPVRRPAAPTSCADGAAAC